MTHEVKKYDPSEPFDRSRKLRVEKHWFAPEEMEHLDHKFRALWFIDGRTVEEVAGLARALYFESTGNYWALECAQEMVECLTVIAYGYDPQFVTEVFKLLARSDQVIVRWSFVWFIPILSRDRNPIIEQIIYEELLFDPDENLASEVASCVIEEIGYECADTGAEMIGTARIQYSREELYEILARICDGGRNRRRRSRPA